MCTLLNLAIKKMLNKEAKAIKKLKEDIVRFKVSVDEPTILGKTERANEKYQEKKDIKRTKIVRK